MATDGKKPLSLRALKLTLKDTQAAFNDILQFVNGFKDDVSTTEVEIRLQKVDELWEKFSAVLVEIRSHEEFPEDSDAYEKDRKLFSDNYYRIKSFLFDKAKGGSSVPVQSVHTNHATEATGHGTLEHVRLPQIQLQTFSGDIDEWLSFRDLFTSLIHWKQDLPEVEKFHYLKGCLQGEPRSIIDSLQLTKANYQIAWDTLLKRYNNSKQLKKRQIQSLFKLPGISKESASDLHGLLEGFERTVQTLDQLVEAVEYKDLLLMNLLTTRLDPATRRGWEEFSSTQEKDTLKGLLEFLRRRLQVLDSLPSRAAVDNKVANPPQGFAKPKATMKTSYNTVQSSGGRCVACSASHPLYQCGTFQRLSASERDAFLRTHSLCRNCLKMGHRAKDCQNKFSCRNCKGRHHTMVCFKRDKDSKASEPSKDENSAASRDSRDSSSSSKVANLAAIDVLVSHQAHHIDSQVLLATAVVVVEDDDGNLIPARALLDSGSESNFITERLSQRLKVDRQQVHVSVTGIGQAATKVKQRIQATIRSRVSDFSRELGFLVLPKVTVNLPTTSIRVKGWVVPQHVQMADPSFFVSKGVDMVLGIEAFFDFFVTGRRISLGDQLPALNESVFGWVVSGGLSTSYQPLKINCHISTTKNLEDLVARFWSCEEIEDQRNYSPEEARCEEIYAQSVKRASSGRYTVSLPKKEEMMEQLGESRYIALRQLQGTEKRLARNADLKEKYAEFMDGYLQTGHMRKVEATDQDSAKRCYLPHHPVVKEASTTTKVRVVFNASCKTSTGISLNDVLLTGPVIQDDLRAIILRSRTKQIMFVADVERMFEQINVFPEDAPLQSILYRPSPKEEVSTFELTTVSYGTKSAPFLATRTLKQLAMDEEQRFPLAAKAVVEDTYMDDVITGSNNIEEAVELRKQIDEMMSSGGFRLRKWASNRSEVLEGITEENLAIRDTDGINLDPDPSVKTLGLTWMPHTDTFRLQFNIPVLDSLERLSKRQVLAMIAALFDPLGLVGAVITTAKLFMQQLWTLQDRDGRKLDWDDPLPKKVAEDWRKFHLHLPLLTEVRVNRCIILPDAVTTEIHCFSDASEKAYGGCVYIRSQDQKGRIAVHLLTSKSRISPLKCQTIPRLELCGALLMAELYEKVNRSIKLSAPVFFWTDSTCVLRWIEAIPTTWSTFVANRVAKIQNITENGEGEWRHVPGVDNPADLISRGIQPQDILHNKVWWHGHAWLTQDCNQWPSTPSSWNSEDGNVEMRRTAVANTGSPRTVFIKWYTQKFSSYSDLVRRTAIWLRFMKMLRTPKEKRNAGFLSTSELRNAEEVLVRLVQREAFPKEWQALLKGEYVSDRSPLRLLHPKISSDNLIRVGGRLQHSQESDEVKHPMVLPSHWHFTRLILRQYHEKLLHAGPQLLLSVVKLRFWPLRGRDMARQTVHKCLRCFRAKPTPLQQFMGDLPSSRVTPSRPFAKTGVDFFGPVYLRPVPRRAAVKAYVAIFICMCTKAVHMELVSDLSTERFLQALRRFVARRGRCTDLYSDNGTNFVGARNKLQEVLKQLKDKDHQEQVSRFCAEEGMNWHFSPPSAPHFGGLWEAAVRSAKHHLLRVLGDNPTTPEDMNTLLTQVEGCLNSRPLTARSEDPSDLEPLTPAHFLVGSSLQSIPEPDLQNTPANHLKHWDLVQQRLQHFWTRWRREYLSQLQGRVKRWRPPVDIVTGKLVIIVDERQPPLRWKMGRIQEVHAGPDGIVRVVTLKTAAGSLKRPVEKLCILPTAAELEDHQSTI